MWFYENSHVGMDQESLFQSTPSHDILTIISFVLFSCLLFWDGINLVRGLGRLYCSLFSVHIEVHSLSINDLKRILCS